MYIYIYIKGATACNRLDAISSRETKACHVDGTKRGREREKEKHFSRASKRRCFKDR